MTGFSVAAIAPIKLIEKIEEQHLKITGLFSWAGLMASVCLMTFGVDLGLDWV